MMLFHETTRRVFWNKAVAAFIGAAVSDVWFRIVFLISKQFVYVSRCSVVELYVCVYLWF